ncbi:MAG: hypothetical protein OHK0032_09840 [Thermodesulfovibrionales bacterium]
MKILKCKIVNNFYFNFAFCTLHFAFFNLLVSPLFALTETDIASYQREIAERPIGERIALWAEKFVGTPYDPDPIGEYVTKKVIIADERVDCMYLSFRAIELAMGDTTEESVRIALDKRFMGRGILKDGRVINYEDRFQYGEDMLDSGKWGREITGDIGPLASIRGSRGREKVGMISRETLIRLSKTTDKQTTESRSSFHRLPLQSGDFVFFVKSPERRVAGEIIGHIGIIKKEGKDIYLIHASGRKNHGNSHSSKTLWGDGNGEVKKVLFYDYVRTMPFVGIRVSRFN